MDFLENVWILIKISLQFVSKSVIYNKLSLVQIMAWRQKGIKPLFEPMMAYFTNIYASLGLNELAHGPQGDVSVILQV